MKQKNKCLMERAIGILDGVSFCSDSANVADALVEAIEILDIIVKDEETEDRHESADG